jgi:hypothetical protein
VKRIAADASSLIAELLRRRGRDLIRTESLRFFVVADAWEETERGLAQRVEVLHTRMLADDVSSLLEEARALVDARIHVVPREGYEVDPL